MQLLCDKNFECVISFSPENAPSQVLLWLFNIKNKQTEAQKLNKPQISIVSGWTKAGSEIYLPQSTYALSFILSIKVCLLRKFRETQKNIKGKSL